MTLLKIGQSFPPLSKLAVLGPRRPGEAALQGVPINGETLAPDHGYPARIVAPNRLGVLQTKWVERLEILP